MGYTYGYIREATQAHIDLDEAETAAMNLASRYHIYANEAMQAICAVKPKYIYFKATIVQKYQPIIRLGNENFRKATQEELEWEVIGAPKPDFADEVSMKIWYEGQNVFLVNSSVKMPEDFIAFANKQAWAILHYRHNPERFINNSGNFWGATAMERKVPATPKMFSYIGGNNLSFLQEGEFEIPYVATWYRFKSGMSDHAELDMPIDILLTIPLYIASQCLQIDHTQRAMAKRAEFETALARCSTTDFMETPIIPMSY